MEYKAVVTTLKLSKHPNADKLQIGHCFGTRVIVGIDTTEDDLGLFFDTGGQLSEEFANANDLVIRKGPDGKKCGGGFFDVNRRVCATRFRGERSDGFWCPLSYLHALGLDTASLKQGDSFHTLDGIPICNKYVLKPNPREYKALDAARIKKKNRTEMFPRHMDTDQLWRVAHTLKYPIECVLTYKLHGTSGRYGHVKVEKHLSKFQSYWNRLAQKFNWLPVFETHEWKYILGTRNVILNGSNGYYEDESFRYRAVKDLLLHKNEVIYFELVGYAGDKPIMAVQKTEPLPDVKKTFGPDMTYKYGCETGQCRLYVYRITQVNENGVQFDLSWQAVKDRCNQLGLSYVPEVDNSENPTTWMFCSADELVHKLTELVDGKSGQQAIHSCIDRTHIEEGIVVRLEGHPIKLMKVKSWVFRVLEGHISATVEDREEMS